MASEPGNQQSLYQGFYFDCDSTLSSIEGIDELTAKCSAVERDQLWDLTNRAMAGEVPLSSVYEQRLARVAPSQAELGRIGQHYIDNLVPGATATIEALGFLGKHIGIVSGGLLAPVAMLAEHLGVPAANVHAVATIHNADGDYVDFDRHSPLCRNGGKIEVLARVPADHRPLLLVGDGVTDLEAKTTVDLFVGFGGVATRARVKAEADIFLAGESLTGVLEIGLSAAEKNTLRADHRFGDLLPIL